MARSKRKELMIINGEDLAATGFTAGDMREGGKAYARWPVIAKDLVEPARTRIVIEEGDHTSSSDHAIL